MITRLSVRGFKNLVNTEIHFGPFTCIAGPNGVGKSNIFDAIMFLSALAEDRTLLEAARSVRGEQRRGVDLAGLFHKSREGSSDRMTFEVDMIVPPQATDHLGQKASATSTFLRYRLALGLRSKNGVAASDLAVLEEALTYIPKREAKKNLPFDHSSQWRESVLCGERRSQYISTRGDVVKLHQDKGTGGRAWEYPLHTLPRTVLSGVTARENPTAVVAREEMRSWRRLQLEPSRLREPDEFQSPASIDVDGAHLSSTLYHLAQKLPLTGEWPDSAAVYSELANRLAELIDDIHTITVDQDEKRELYTVMAAGRDGVFHPAKSLSDGTLRFLALAVMQLDPQAVPVLCLEEPENGIHPERIGAMLSLLMDIASDCQEPVDELAPLRQVIINTHSPAVVGQSPESSVVILETGTYHFDNHKPNTFQIQVVEDTWRARTTEPALTISKGKLYSFLNPLAARQPTPAPSVKRIIDRKDMRQPFLPRVLSQDEE